MEEPQTWVENFHAIEGHDFFVELDNDFLKDRFYLTGIPTGHLRLGDVISRIIGPAPESDSELEEDGMEQSDEAVCRHFYGIAHSRYIMETYGQQKLLRKFQNGEYGRCPRALCRSQPVLPIGINPVPGQSCVKLFCPKCEDLYHPADPKHAALDGAFFGPNAAFSLFQSYPKQLPRRTSEQFTLKMFGFKLHDHAKLTRWQQKRREEMERKLRQAEV